MRMLLVVGFGALLVLLAVGHSQAMGSRKTLATTLSGTVRLVGNEPHPQLVLTTADRAGTQTDYLLTGPLAGQLRATYQGQQVTLEGKPCASPSPRFAHCFAAERIVVPTGR